MYVDTWNVVVQLFVDVCYIVVVVVVVTGSSVLVVYMCLYILVDNLCVVLCKSHWSVVFHGH
jgi:hypothetical protein